VAVAEGVAEALVVAEVAAADDGNVGAISISRDEVKRLSFKEVT
jgi:hypothetical protein